MLDMRVEQLGTATYISKGSEEEIEWAHFGAVTTTTPCGVFKKAGFQVVGF